MKFKIYHDVYLNSDGAIRETYQLRVESADDTYFKYLASFKTVEEAEKYAAKYVKLIEPTIELEIN